MRAYRVAYDGRAYHGFQRQPSLPTVEGALFDALADHGIEFEDAPPGYAAAGRTDAGVSALAQTIAFDAPAWLSPHAFTAYLPEDVHVWASTPVPEDFHATHHARWREYTYLLHAPSDDPERRAEIEARLAGEHDFHNLAAADAGTVRDLTVRSDRTGEYLRVRVRAGGFPRQLVRRLLGLYDRVLRGDRDLAFVDRVLAPEPLPGPEGFPPAPAYPLVLTEVNYDQSFDPEPEAVEAARTVFERRARADRTRAAVGRTLQQGIGGSTGDNP
ncbi:tRNA pseudouridine(38-40) synthase TruA [Halodesulfurarchaeum sp. HSR-GB]|uniref:tRNA pseudouridine(38-40) synthase TruA n=1 Tax=Halodesulfurarchaeum sp. HSR-GB TaxID=3074077 RepID=UPI002860C0E4|nr:tRNA pseudouridine(38-40) synthase TruA [Halodesulfurarchaeum sp. HSR-GB]MDR5656031.1 tRNA pseudouridine(38-40) synthase TruA [Halodesulfurarchaeum sp. HSR-GB]